MAVAYKILARKRKGGIPLERYRRRWQKNIKTNLKGTGFEDVDWAHLVPEWNQWWALENTVVNLQVPQKVENVTS